MISFLLLCTIILSLHGANIEHAPHPLPPCGSYSDCLTPAYNFLPHVSSLSTCQSACQSDPQCYHYSYNYSVTSHLYRHCFLHTECVRGGVHSGTRGWVSGTKLCQAGSSPLVSSIMSANNGLLRTTKWLPDVFIHSSIYFIDFISSSHKCA